MIHFARVWVCARLFVSEALLFVASAKDPPRQESNHWQREQKRRLGGWLCVLGTNRRNWTAHWRKEEKKNREGKKKRRLPKIRQEKGADFSRAAGDSLNYHRRRSEAGPDVCLLFLFCFLQNMRKRDIRPRLATWQLGVTKNVQTAMHFCMIKTQCQVVPPLEAMKGIRGIFQWTHYGE